MKALRTYLIASVCANAVLALALGLAVVRFGVDLSTDVQMCAKGECLVVSKEIMAEMLRGAQMYGAMAGAQSCQNKGISL